MKIWEIFSALFISTVVFFIFMALAHAQSLSQEQQQGARDKINSDLVQINQITRDEVSLNQQYQASYSSKQAQIDGLNQEVYLLNSWLNPPPNVINSDNSTPGNTADTQGTVRVI